MINPNPIVFSRPELVCPKCGLKEQVKGQNFCSSCGEYIINRCSGVYDNSFDFDDAPFNYKIVEVGETKECPVTYLPSQFKFCHNCGAISTYHLQDVFNVD
ncbi:hypothetical protein [Holzapfeliella sp. JNUCC 80]